MNSFRFPPQFLQKFFWSSSSNYPGIPPKSVLLDFVQHLPRSSSRTTLGIPLDFLYSTFGLFPQFFQGFFQSSSMIFFSDSPMNSYAVPPAIVPEFIQQFFQSSSRNYFKAATGISSKKKFSSNSSGVPSVIPPDDLREILQSSSQICLKVSPGILSEFFQEFFRYFSRISFEEIAWNFSRWILQEFIRSFFNFSSGISSNVLIVIFQGFSRNFFVGPSRIPSAFLQEVLRSSLFR